MNLAAKLFLKQMPCWFRKTVNDQSATNRYLAYKDIRSPNPTREDSSHAQKPDYST
jgi:hypothetical protein